LAFFLVLWLSWLVARLVSFVLGQEVFPRLPMKEGVPFALTTFTRYAIITIGFIVAISAMGVPLDKLTIMLSALGVGIGFGLQKLASTVVSGFILLSERPVRLQDIIQLDSMFGRVSNIGIRASTIRTFDGAEVIVPNDDLISARLVNWTLSDLDRRVIIPIGVAYGTDPNEVLTILRRVASENDRVLRSPEPQALFRAFGESSLDFELRFHVEASGVVEVPSELHLAITEAFAEAGITIPFPQRDLHLRSAAEGVFPPGSVATAAGAEG
jgi:small-conductance mechanosensitive channel